MVLLSLAVEIIGFCEKKEPGYRCISLSRYTKCIFRYRIPGYCRRGRLEVEVRGGNTYLWYLALRYTHVQFWSEHAADLVRVRASLTWGVSSQRFLAQLRLPNYIFVCSICINIKISQTNRRDRAYVVIICPVVATQSCFHDLLGMSIDCPRWLLWNDDLVTSPMDEAHPFVKSVSLHLAVWRLSGIPSEGRASRKRWSTFYWPATHSTPSRRTARRGARGSIGICGTVSIPYLPIGHVLEHLCFLKEARKSFNIINVHKSMLSTTLPPSMVSGLVHIP